MKCHGCLLLAEGAQRAASRHVRSFSGSTSRVRSYFLILLRVLIASRTSISIIIRPQRSVKDSVICVAIVVVHSRDSRVWIVCVVVLRQWRTSLGTYELIWTFYARALLAEFVGLQAQYLFGSTVEITVVAARDPVRLLPIWAVVCTAAIAPLWYWTRKRTT